MALFLDLFVFWVQVIILTINPINAKGILTQLKAPKQGIKPNNMPQIAKIPKTKLAVFI
ncbi:MAG: hypothetical protein Q4B43_08925 [Bacteroidota bacterium]|nr:hypothetical protein [Bacteroidota bacterium]